MSLDNIISNAKKEPKEITGWINTLDDLIDVFEKHNKMDEFVCYNFNGYKLDSKMTPDEIYLKVTNETRQQFKDNQEKARLRYQAQEEEQVRKAPELTKKYIAEGKEILPVRSHKSWEECVKANVESTYGDLILTNFLELAKSLKNNVPLEEVQKQLDNQGHSGFSYSIMKNLLTELTDNGSKIFEVEEFEKNNIGEER